VSAVSSWIDQNWFSFLQSVGIVGSLLLTATALRRDSRSRRASDLLNLLEQHRQLWGEIHRRPELVRILSKEVDLVAQPISLAEEEFINLIVVHYHTGWMLARAGTGNNVAALAADIRGLFSLPLPKAVWRQTKDRRDQDFARFVDSSLEG
jgi:hypothetical protein